MKVKLGGRTALYPMPVTLVGAMVDGKPNYITIAHVGIMDMRTVSLSMGKNHYTNDGIRANGTFSVNIAPEFLVKETDYCGLVSGRDADKSALFETFFGELETAPMIEQCPINMECRLVQTVDFTKIKPILFAMYDQCYFTLGERFAKAWSIGKELME
jgi:flavin reductase (DIM6/NTAB) family NADH-FMN oxidoreductase RutF